MIDKRDQRRGGFYWVDGEPYASVTEILTVIDKSALRYWFGREVYYAMVKDPTLSQQVAMAAPYKSNTKAKDRGTAVHKFVEMYKSKNLQPLPEGIREYGRAFHDWYKGNTVEFLAHEKSVISHKHGYAGTADAVCKINNDDIWLLDVKTGKAIYDEVTLQLSAYASAMEEHGEKIDHIGVLLLETGQDDNATGKYIFRELKRDLEPFLAAKTLWKWQNQNKLVKAGYRF